MNAMAAIDAYKNAGLEMDVLTADSHKLVSLLFDGALLAISQAKIQMQQGDTAAKGQSISHAMAIIGEGLQASLDMKAGGEIATELSGLYGYMVKRLLQANVDNDPATLDEVAKLLGELRDAWNAIRPQVLQTIAGSPSPEEKPRTDNRG